MISTNRLAGTALHGEPDGWPDTRGGELDGVPTRDIVRSLPLAFPVMPRRRMQELLRRRDQVSELVAVLSASARHGGGGGDRLWTVVVLGELRHPAAVASLGRLLGGGDDLGVAAAEALGKIGAPAVAFLARVVARAERPRRLRAYGALGMIRTEDAYQCLRRALPRDRELGDVVARALAQHGRREAIELLWRTSLRAAGWMRREFESAIAALAHGPVGADPVQSDWRVRYRRLPRLEWRVPPSWLTLAGMQPRGTCPTRPAPPRSIDEIVADVALQPGGPPCPVCGGAYWRPTGLPVCRHAGRATLALQRASLAHWLTRGVTDVWRALDACDAAEIALGRLPDAAPGGDLTAVARATLYWLVAVNCQVFRMGMHHLRVIADEFPADARARVAGVDGRRRVRVHPAATTVSQVPRERRSRPPNCW